MRFDILGPLRVLSGDTDRVVTAGRDRIVLGVLLLRAGHVVAADELVDALWAGGPPLTARGQVQTCVSRLRRALPGVVIVTDPAGYAIRVGADDLDAVVFARLTAEARAVGGTAPDVGRRLFRRALDLWRGPALAGIDSDVVRRGAAVLDEQRMVAIEDWVDLELVGGCNRDLVGELTALVEQFPLRERLRAQLMLALVQAGRQADALGEYRRGRSVLRDELGIEPGVVLRETHRRILAGGVSVSEDPVVLSVPVRCLPRTVGDFTGRVDVVTRLVRAVELDVAVPGVQLIDGMAGSGKTTLALHVAALVGDRYPDAHLFVDLQGQSERAPVDPAAALVTLLRQLGIGAERIPAGVDDRVAMWRTELAARRVLVVLDNAASSAQVRPLLPAGPGCLTFVTSRRRLTGLDGVSPESLRVLTEREGVELLTRIVGARVADEPEAAVEVVRRCGRLPLAIRLAGSRLAHRQRWRVADLVHRLAEHGSALPELAAEDRTVTNAFALSYGQLAPAARRVFRLLGALPGERFDVYAVAALTDLPVDAAQSLLDDLVDVHLIEEPEAGLHRLHDLMREYAATLAAPDPEKDAAVERLLDHQIHAAAGFTRLLKLGDSVLDRIPVGVVRRPDLLPVSADGQRWLEWNRPGLLAMIEAAVALGDPRRAWVLARVMWRFLYVNCYPDDIVQSQTRGLSAARQAGDDLGTAHCLNYLASAYFRLGRLGKAYEALHQALDLQIGLGDDSGSAIVRGNIAAVLFFSGRLEDALEEAQATLATWRRIDETGVSRALATVGQILLVAGRLNEAMRYNRLNLLAALDQRSAVLVAMALGHVGQVRLRMGQPDVALRLLRTALRLKLAHDFHSEEAEARNDLAVALRLTGQIAEAIEQHLLAVAAAQKRGEARWESLTRNGYAATLAAAGERDVALDQYRRALELARRSGSVLEQARALDGIAAILVEAAPDDAQRHWEQALEIYATMGVPEQLEVRRRLAAMSDGMEPQLTLPSAVKG